ncbi:MAG: beta-ketoacyl-ACP synthase II [Phycisphaerales bacterium]
MAAQHARRVVVTGFGAVTNLGPDAHATWLGMRDGRSGITAITGAAFEAWPEDQWPVRIGGEISGWDPTQRIDRREAKRLDRFAQLGITAGIEAWEHSGIDINSETPDRCGCVIGSGVGGIQTIEESVKTLLDKGPTRISPFTVPRLMANAIAGDLSIRFGLEGPSDSHTTACASSGHSIGDAVAIIRRNEADVMLAGGAEGAVSPLCLASFMTMKALSTRNDDPTAASRPFDRDRDGFVLAEGAAVLVLEELEHAKARGATIHAEILGFAASSDAYHITAPDEGGKGAAKAMSNALKDAGLNVSDVNYINAHGTSTPLGDVAEVNAVMKVFGDHARKSAGGRLLMSSSKSMTGHCLGASGGVESISCLGAFRERVVTPTINCHNPDDAFDMDFVPHEAREADIKVALNNTFGFGGHNVSIALGRYDG